ncbi:dentin sialophosphoprotein-like [Nasonia vitripennis]|uniref:Uncharacterized protein n=1 Tax=Nasonia vitripennis TaxID=7425 RepID=A0A7M7Q960_NASVI|nr:dentin sialophosphoprotein-like [Nasonia vitripennis]
MNSLKKSINTESVQAILNFKSSLYIEGFTSFAKMRLHISISVLIACGMLAVASARTMQASEDASCQGASSDSSAPRHYSSSHSNHSLGQDESSLSSSSVGRSEHNRYAVSNAESSRNLALQNEQHGSRTVSNHHLAQSQGSRHQQSHVQSFSKQESHAQRAGPHQSQFQVSRQQESIDHGHHESHLDVARHQQSSAGLQGSQIQSSKQYFVRDNSENDGSYGHSSSSGQDYRVIRGSSGDSSIDRRHNQQSSVHTSDQHKSQHDLSSLHQSSGQQHSSQLQSSHQQQLSRNSNLHSEGSHVYTSSGSRGLSSSDDSNKYYVVSDNDGINDKRVIVVNKNNSDDSNLNTDGSSCRTTELTKDNSDSDDSSDSSDSKS